jgi:hypothetical protein
MNTQSHPGEVTFTKPAQIQPRWDFELCVVLALIPIILITVSPPSDYPGAVEVIAYAFAVVATFRILRFHPKSIPARLAFVFYVLSILGWLVLASLNLTT